MIVRGVLETTSIDNHFAKKSLQESQFAITSLASQMQACWDATIRTWLSHNLDQTDASRSMRWCVSSVHDLAAHQLRNWLTVNRPEDSFWRITQADVPQRNQLENPKATGIDRLLAGWFAFERLGLKTAGVIVVDAGSAVTIDWVDRQAVFQGGMIFPGLRLSANSLSLGTDALPEVQITDPQRIIHNVFGRSTVPAIESGLYWSQWGGICHGVTRLQQVASSNSQCPAAVVVTGGGMRMFEPLIPADWDHQPDLMVAAILQLADQADKSSDESLSQPGTK